MVPGKCDNVFCDNECETCVSTLREFVFVSKSENNLKSSCWIGIIWRENQLILLIVSKALRATKI